MNPLLIRRRGMMVAQGGGGAMVEIEYLESTGTQYIMLPFNGYGIVTIEMKVQFTEISTQCILGARNSTRNSCKVFGVNSNGNFYVNVGDVVSNIVNGGTADTNLHTVKVVAGNNAQSLFIDGVQKGSSSSNINRVSTSNLAVFAMNFNGSISEFSKAKLYEYLRVEKNGVTIFDAIPKRIGSVGYLFDNVSGQLFGNAGTDPFILGPDVQ